MKVCEFDISTKDRFVELIVNKFKFSTAPRRDKNKTAKCWYLSYTIMLTTYLFTALFRSSLYLIRIYNYT